MVRSGAGLEARALASPFNWALFLLVLVMYWALLLSDPPKAQLPLGGAHYVAFQLPSLLWEGCLPGAQGLTGEQVIVQQLLLDDIVGHHLSTVDNGIPRDVGESSCWKGSSYWLTNGE